MKLTETKELKICPFKSLYYINGKSDGKTIAIICSSQKIHETNLQFLDDYIIFRVTDGLDETFPLAFSYIHGMKIRNFLDSNSDYKRLYVCCDSGESRSTALAAAIMKYYGLSDMKIWRNPYYHPNRLVYKKQMQAFGKRVSKFKLKYLHYISENALRLKIKAAK